MSNSDSIPTTPKTLNLRPHRRLSLTQSTETPQEPTGAALSAAQIVSSAPTQEIAPDVAPTVRVMAYLSADEARLLDETWLKLRSHPSRPSKSDILRAACALAAQDFDVLAKILSEQQVSTLSRQRSSKSRRNAA